MNSHHQFLVGCIGQNVGTKLRLELQLATGRIALLHHVQKELGATSVPCARTRADQKVPNELSMRFLVAVALTAPRGL